MSLIWHLEQRRLGAGIRMDRCLICHLEQRRRGAGMRLDHHWLVPRLLHLQCSEDIFQLDRNV